MQKSCRILCITFELFTLNPWAKVRLNGVNLRRITRMTVAQARGVTDAVIYMAPRGYGPLTTTRALSVARSASLRAQSVYLHWENRRHFSFAFSLPDHNEILAANCSRGRCPSGKTHERWGERKWARWLEEEFEREIVGCFQCAAVKSSADTFFFSFDSRLSLIATSKVSGDISTAWLVFLHLDARLRFVALRDISQGLERDRCFLHGMCLDTGMLRDLPS